MWFIITCGCVMKKYMFLAMVSKKTRKNRLCASVDISVLTFVEKIHSQHCHVNGISECSSRAGMYRIRVDCLWNGSWR